MPKIPSKINLDKQMPIEELAEKLLSIEKYLTKVKLEVSKLWIALYTKGLEGCDPLQDDDDIPF
jgi:hypothetical protein